MSKQTILEITQGLLASMDSDEVNSIHDTVESYDVALTLRDVYYDIAVELDLPAHETLFELEASGDVDQPVRMKLPVNVAKAYWIKYDNKLTGDTNSSYEETCFVPLEEFIERQTSLTETTTASEMTFCVNDEDFEVMYHTDRFPSFYTHIGGDTLIFDAINTDEDTTLNKSKTMCFGLVYPTFLLEDTFTPDLDVSQFPYYRNRAKVRVFSEKKQAENREAASEARNQKIILQKRKHRHNEGTALERQTTRYGRK